MIDWSYGGYYKEKRLFKVWRFSMNLCKYIKPVSKIFIRIKWE